MGRLDQYNHLHLIPTDTNDTNYWLYKEKQ